MHRAKPKFEVLVSAELADLTELYEPCYKRSKILIPVEKELGDLTDFYCEFRTPVPIRRDLSCKSTQLLIKHKSEVTIEGRLMLKQLKVSSVFQQTKTRFRKKVSREEVV